MGNNNLHGSLNHVSLTVSDLRDAMTFFRPFLDFLGFQVEGTHPPSADAKVVVNVNPDTGMAVNIWAASDDLKGRPFEVYAPGLHHVAFNVGSEAKVEEAATLIPSWGGSITDGPAEFPYAHFGYYAVYFTGPDGMKFELVYMPELDNRSGFSVFHDYGGSKF